MIFRECMAWALIEIYQTRLTVDTIQKTYSDLLLRDINVSTYDFREHNFT